MSVLSACICVSIGCARLLHMSDLFHSIKSLDIFTPKHAVEEEMMGKLELPSCLFTVWLSFALVVQQECLSQAVLWALKSCLSTTNLSARIISWWNWCCSCSKPAAPWGFHRLGGTRARCTHPGTSPCLRTLWGA